MELYQQKSSKYYTAYFVVNGRRYRKSTKQTTRAKAGEVAAEFLRQAQRNESPVRKGQMITLREFAEKTFLPWIEDNAGIKAKTKECYRDGWQSIQGQAIAGMKMDAIRTTHIESIRIDGSPSTHNRALRTLSRMFHIAYDLDVIPKVPKFTLLEENKRTELITPDIEQRISAELCKSKRKDSLRVALPIILDCGLRPIEVVNLKVTDIDFARGVIRIQESKTSAGKRLVPMTERVKGLVAKQIGSQMEGWVFPSPRYPGQHIKRHALTRAWRATANRAGVSPDVDLYCARHTFGTDVMYATKDPFLTMRILGHTELSTTARYQHPDMARIGALMDERNQSRSDLRHNPRHSGELV